MTESKDSREGLQALQQVGSSMKKISHVAAAVAALAQLAMLAVPSALHAAAENSSACSYYQTVTLSGAGGTASQSNYPLLVRLTSSNAVWAHCNSNGYDIQFFDPTGATAYPFQRAYWNWVSASSTANAAEFWVQVPTVAASGTATNVRMYWGNPGATDASSGSGVFSSTNNYKAVWHMNSTQGATSESDATSYGQTATANGTITNVTGPGGGATSIGKSFSSSYYSVSGSGSGSNLDLPAGGPYTISCWMETGTTGNTNIGILGKLSLNGNTSGSNYWIGTYGLGYRNGGVNYNIQAAEVYGTSSSDRWYATNNPVGSWSHLAMVRNGTGGTGSSLLFYINGTAVTTSTGTWTAFGATPTHDQTQTFCIGKDAGSGGTGYFPGYISEIQILNTNQNASWVTLNYQTQGPGWASYLTFGGQQNNSPTLSTPTNGAANQPLTLTLSWQTDAGATSYAVQVSTVSTFASTVTGTGGTGLTSLSQSVSGLTGSTTYYWEVNATINGVTSAWAAAWSFTTTPPPPEAPELSTPENGQGSVPLAPNLTWGSVSGATSYEVQVSLSSMFGSTIFDQTGLTGLSATVSGLSNGTTYYWRANASNVGGTSSWSGAWSFTTVPFPAPVLISPSNGSTNQPVAPALVWNTVSGAASYSLQVSQNSAFSSTVFSQGGLTALSQAVGPLSYIMTYFWQVNAYDGTSQTTAWSSIWSFTTSFPLPGTPVLSSPTSGTIDLPASLTLTWGQANLATSYNLKISTSSTFATTFLSQSVSGASASVNNLALGTTYYWEVAGADINGQGSWSLIWSFTTATTAALANGDRAALKTDFVVKGDALLYSLASSGAVRIAFSDILGREKAVIDRLQSSGHYTLSLKSLNLSPGVYLIHFKAGNKEETMKAMVGGNR